MKHKFIAAAWFLALSVPALADQTAPAPNQSTASPRAERILKRLDTNGDGVISFKEFKFPGDPMIKAADTNGDGAVSLAEWQSYQAKMMAKRETRMKERAAKMQARMDQRFKSMDTNGDGKVTLDEMRAAVFKRLDKNGDGVLSADELNPPRRHWRHRDDGGMPPPPPPGDEI